jgi:pimeloyl-ACP methyl ester carboxylesterase
MFGNLDNWQTLARKWADAYRVILVDLRNHGRSPHADEMSYPLMAEDVATFLEGQGIDRCHLLGHSMGGKVAMQAALSYPGLVERLVVVDMAARQYGRGHEDVFTALKALDPSAITDRRHADELMQPHMPDPGVRMFLLKNLARDDRQGFRWRMNLEVLDRDYDRLIAPVGEGSPPFTGPVLFVRGADSDYVRDADIPPIRNFFPAAEVRTVAGAGHWLHAERPDKLEEMVRRFLA